MPPAQDGSHGNFWRCGRCAKVNFRNATLCSGCDTPSGGADGSDIAMSPASVGYLRSSAAVAVNAKVAGLQEMLEEQRKKFERDVVTLRKQLDTALNAHNSLLASQRQYMTSSRGAGGAGAGAGGGGASAGADVAALESGYQQQIALLQQQQQAVTKERDDAAAQVSALKRQLDTLVSRCDAAATEYAGAMRQLEESEQARNALLAKLEKKAAEPQVAPPVPGTVGANSSAVLNLEKQVADLTAANAALRAEIADLHARLEHQASMAPVPSASVTASMHGSGNNMSSSVRSATATSAASASVDALRSAICTKLSVSALATAAPAVDAGLRTVADEITALLRETEAVKASRDSLQRRWEENVAELEQLEEQAKERSVEWERERDSLKKKLAQVEKDVQEADTRERDACLTMNAMDAILSDSLWALKQQQQHQVPLGAQGSIAY